jgi:putative transposase
VEYENFIKVKKPTQPSTLCIQKKNKATFQANIVVKHSKSKYKEKRAKYFAYAAYGINIPLKNTFKEYRKRFGIESSYRLMNRARIHTEIIRLSLATNPSD